MSEEEKQYKVVVHLTDGTKLEVFGAVSATDLIGFYRCMGAKESRVKFPTAADTMQFLPANSVLRFEATGEYE